MQTFSKPRPAGIADAAGAASLRVLLDVLAGRAGDAPPPLDAAGWAAFVAEASRHGVSALAHASLAAREGVPPEVARSLEAQYLRNRLRNLRLYARLGVLLERFGAQSIDVIVLKGAYLGHAVYPDAALRAMSDVDLLVREGDLQRAAGALRAMGWQQGDSAIAAGGHQLPTFEFEGVHVDLHWNIEDDAAPFAIDLEGLWERAAPTGIANAQALALAPEDLLLHLCLHSTYGHGWKQFDGGLRQLVDIATLLRHHGSTFDWPALSQRARSWHAERCVWLCLVTARDLLDAPVPPVMLDRIAQPQPRWARLAAQLALGCHYDELARRLPVLARLWVDKHWRRLSRLERWRRRLLPARGSLRHIYPTLAARAPLMLGAHWKDLASDLLRIAFDGESRALLRRERERHALIAWLEQGAGGADASRPARSAGAERSAIAQAGGHR